MQFAHAADGDGAPAPTLDEVVVTGSRIIRDGYEAPTPLTVVGVEQAQQQAAPNLIDYLTTLPAFAGNYTPQGSTQNVSTGTAGTSSVNLRNLGTNRTLVLIDGQRSVGSTVTGLVDINGIPQQLVERVEVVTGGASAAYGSDAVSGVVNFILDKKFTGFKGEVSGGSTTFGDNPSYKVALTGGNSFADGRGHFVVSGQLSSQDGVLEADRDWNQEGWQIINNPANKTDLTQPARLLLPRIGPSNATPGGIIVGGKMPNGSANNSLNNIAFGLGGTPYMFTPGSLVSGNAMQGGDWEASSLHVRGQSLEPKLAMQNVFARASFDVTDAVQVFVQSSWYANQNVSHAYPNEYFGGLTIKPDNAFLPAPIAAQAQALGLASMTMGTSNQDLGTVAIETERKVVRNVVGANGKFDALGTDWSWDAYAQLGESRNSESATHSANLVRFADATDAVRNGSGAIVCRSTLTNPGNGCVPYNPFGIGVNSQAAVDYINGRPHRDQAFKQNVYAASLNGSPFSSWAGPVSLATGIEHRTEEVSGWATDADLAGVYFAGNYRPTKGKYDVTEEFLETVVPLASEKPWAKSLDLNAAVRFTDYSISGSVTTWKVGATYRPIDDLMFRVTRSRDIRAPNLNDLFNAGSKVNNLVVDNATNTPVAYEGTTTGNLNLDPEEADSTGFGVVYQPSFAPGLSASVDYWNIDLKDAINTLTAQQIVDACFQGNQTLCQAINGGQPLRPTSGADRNAIAIQPFNLAQQLVRGVDIETSYRAPLSIFNDGWDGNFVVRVLATRFLKNYTDNTLTMPLDTAGQNTGGGPPDWRWSASLGYNNDPFTATVTARGVSSGVYGNNFIECTSGCPVSTIDHPTINDNHIPGATYFDLSLSYTILTGRNESLQMQTFFNVRNITNKDPVIVAGGPSGLPFDTVTTNPANYDSLGRVFMAGVRFKM
jgi:outer membrane receptor protein involved in Fe transport